MVMRSTPQREQLTTTVYQHFPPKLSVVFQSKADPTADALFRSCDLDVYLMTLTYKLDRDIPKMYLRAPKLNVPCQGIGNLQPEQDIKTWPLFAPVTSPNWPNDQIKSNQIY